jgi:hypothetical protein
LGSIWRLPGHIVGDLLVKAGEIQTLFHGNTKDKIKFKLVFLVLIAGCLLFGLA